MRILFKLIGIFVIIGIIVTASSSYVSYNYGKDALEKRIMQQLASVALLKEKQMADFVDEQAETLGSIAKDEGFIKAVGGKEVECGDENACAGLNRELGERLFYNDEFSEFFVIGPEGAVEASTSSENAGKSVAETEFFKKGKEGAFVQGFYFEQNKSHPLITISSPIKGSTGMLAGNIDLGKIDSIMLDTYGLGKTGEIYIVGEFGAENENKEKTDRFDTLGVTDCLGKKPEKAYAVYKNHNGLDVISFYKWIPERNVCIIAELGQEEAFEPIKKLRELILLVNLEVMLITIIIGIALSRKLAVPIIRLKDIALRIGKGHFSTKVEIKSKDEIGELGNSIRDMARELKEAREKLEGYNKRLEKDVRIRTKELVHKTKESDERRLVALRMMKEVKETNKKLMDAETRLRRNVKELRLLDRQKDEFVLMTSHELKTPLASVQGFVSLLQNKDIAENAKKRNEYMAVINKDLARLGSLITNIVDLSKLDLKAMKFNFERVEIPKMLVEIESNFEPAATAIGISLKIEMEKNLPVITADKARLMQVFSNLMNNALHFTHEGGTIVMSAKKEKGHMHFCVKDTGEGIVKANLKNLFQRFFQADTRKNVMLRSTGGAGLGLPVCKGIVEQMCGKIWAESTAGKGSEFHFTVPINVGNVNKEEKQKEEEK